jgi:cytochrome c-type biogenesis protein
MSVVLESGLTRVVGNGSLALAGPIALAAGLVSFFSPCVLPLVPSYFAYATGLSGDTVNGGGAPRRRLVAGAALFCLGFGVVFVALGVGVGALGRLTLVHQDGLTRLLGFVSIALGLLYLDVIRWRAPVVSLRWFPGVGLGLAPLLGALFAAIWLPCTGPVLGTILTLAYSSGSAARGGSLLVAYTVGLSIPFLLVALLWSRAMSAVRLLARHGRVIRLVAGGAMVLIGVAMLLGWWTYATQWLQVRSVGLSL